MLYLDCYSTGSLSGNCYALRHNEEVLLLDCGIPIKEIKKNNNWRVDNIVGCLVTHKHLDHSKAASDLEKNGVAVFKPYERETPQRYHYEFGSFSVYALPMYKNGKWLHTNGDGTECAIYMYLIVVEGLRVAYVTDSMYLPYRFTKPPVNAFLIACNHDDDMEQDSGKFIHSVTGHSSLKTVCGIIDANKSAMLTEIILCHISRDADPDKMVEEVRSHADPWTGVCAAEPGLRVPLAVFPF